MKKKYIFSSMGHRVWNHICWLYQENKNVIYVNGKQEYQMESISPFHYVLKGFNGEQFTMILGQEPDQFNGDFDKTESLRGKLSEFNIWNYTLADNTIQNIASCRELTKGNILSWEKQYLTVFGVEFFDIEHSQFCQPVVYTVPVTKRMTQDEAEMYCNVHGGSVYTPTSKKSNADLLKLFNNSFQECIDNSTKFFLWLGIEPGANSTWVYSNNRSMISYKNQLYSNWDEESCVMLQTDGLWKDRLKSDCIYFKLCFVCLFEQEPVFTLRGLTCLATNYDFIYYLSPSAKGIEFKGYKEGMIWEENQNWRLGWDMNGQYGNSSELLSYPIGRHSWYISNKMCEDKNTIQTLTFSSCNFRTDFTCDSGKCVDLRKQCDQHNDCTDASDEVECISIVTEANYSPLEPPTVQGQINPLLTTVKILQFDEVDTLKMHLTLTMEIEIRWHDQRLNFANLQLESFDNVSDITGK